MGEADHAAGIGRLVAAPAPDLDPEAVLLGLAERPPGDRQLGFAVLSVLPAVMAAEVGTGVVGHGQTRQNGRSGCDGTPDDELPFDLPHAPSFDSRGPWCAVAFRFARIAGNDRQRRVFIRGPGAAR